MSRYEPVTNEVNELVEKIKNEFFSHLEGARIISIFDSKKKSSGGNVVVARIKKMNDELRFFAMNDSGISYDYAIFIDSNIWNVIEDRDKERIIFHELCHCEVDFEKKNPFFIKDHEIQGFHDETWYNNDDPRWPERIATVVQSVYDPENVTKTE